MVGVIRCLFTSSILPLGAVRLQGKPGTPSPSPSPSPRPPTGCANCSKVLELTERLKVLEAKVGEQPPPRLQPPDPSLHPLPSPLSVPTTPMGRQLPPQAHATLPPVPIQPSWPPTQCPALRSLLFLRDPMKLPLLVPPFPPQPDICRDPRTLGWALPCSITLILYPPSPVKLFLYVPVAVFPVSKANHVLRVSNDFKTTRF